MADTGDVISTRSGDGGILVNLLISSIIGGSMTLLYIVGRPKFPTFYFPRKIKEAALHKSFAFIPYIVKKLPFEELEDTGHYGLLYMRQQRWFFAYTCLCAALCLVVLLPVNLSGDLVGSGFGFIRSTGVNITDAQSKHLWAHAFVEVVLSLSALAVLFMYQRQHFQTMKGLTAKGGVEHQTVKIRHLPRTIQKDRQLFEYLERRYPGEIAAVHLGVEMAEVTKNQKKLKATEERLAAAEDLVTNGQKRPMTKPGASGLIGMIKFWVKKVDAIHYYEGEIARLKTEIIASQRSHARTGFPCKSHTAFVTFKSPRAANTFVRRHLELYPEVDKQLGAQKKGQSTQGGYEAMSTDDDLGGGEDVPLMEMEMGQHDVERSADGGEERKPFDKQRSASFRGALGSVPVLGDALTEAYSTTMRERTWRVKLAPHPSEILWSNLKVNSPFERFIRWSVVQVIILLIALLWAIPIATLSSVSAMAELTEGVPVIGEFFDTLDRDWPLFTSAFEAIVPPLLAVASEQLIRLVLTQICLLQKPHSLASLEHQVQKGYFIYSMCNVIIFNSILKGGIAWLDTYVQEENSETLGDALQNIEWSDAGAFYINFLIIKAIVGAPVAACRVSAFMGWFIKDRAAKTKREKDKISTNSRKRFRYSVYFPKLVVYLTIVFMFCEIVPLVVIPAMLLFSLRHFADKTNILCGLPRNQSIDGRMIPTMTYEFLFGLLLSQIASIAFFSLKHKINAAYLLLCLPVITVAVWYYMSREFKRHKRGVRDVQLTGSLPSTVVLEHAYCHPALIPVDATEEDGYCMDVLQELQSEELDDFDVATYEPPEFD